MRPEFWSPEQYRANLIHPLGDVTSAMERTGCPVSLARLRDISATARTTEAELRGELSTWAGRDVNWSSWQQLAAFLHTDSQEDGGLALEPSPFWKKGEVDVDAGEVKTDDRALEWLAAHNPDQRAHIQKIRSLRRELRAASYAEDWIEKAIRHADGTARLHPSFGLGSDHDTRPGAKTGRFAVKNPPLNQVPKADGSAVGEYGVPSGSMALLRSAFVPPPGYRLVVVDYSQLEIVILAHLIAVLFGADDPLVQKVRAREDIHGPLARFVFGELAGDREVAAALVADFKVAKRLKMLRNLAKAGIYGNNYGKGKQGFATSLFLPDGSVLGEARAELLVDGLKRFYPGISTYQDFIREWITGHCSIISLFGRLMLLPGARARKQGDRNRAWRQALNFPMQAGGQEIMGLALLRIFGDALLKELGFVLSLVVHDEIVGFAPEDKAEQALVRVEELMVTAVELEAPLIAEGHTGANWAESKQ
jgi:DNA polymerase-1